MTVKVNKKSKTKSKEDWVRIPMLVIAQVMYARQMEVQNSMN